MELPPVQVFQVRGYGGGTGTGSSSYMFGGGGGSGAVGGNATSTTGGVGGVGTQVNIDGNNYYWAAGGGGSAFTNGTAGNGGLGGGELGVLVAPAGIGKTWCLQSLASHLVKQGKTVVHYTLELNEAYVGLRYDTVFSGTPTANIKFYQDDVTKSD